MKKFSVFMFVFMFIFLFSTNQNNFVYANTSNDFYKIFDENSNEYLTDLVDFKVGDEFLNNNFKLYKITKIDNVNFIGYAKFVEQKNKPDINFSFVPKQISQEDKQIGLYMSHNDESYVIGDGTESIYGAGGIHDIAKELKKQLEKLNINVHIDETLHIPHDTKAYTRSNVTAKGLLKNDLDALFDVHRDGVARSNYLTYDEDGNPRSKVRIVVGKANSNYKINEQFAIYLLAVGQELYPWLFTNIFYASGHYNQALNGKMLLFEMGTHLIEKEYVLNTMSCLANVINTSLYNTTVNDSTGDLTINGNVSSEETTINDALDNIIQENNVQKANVIGLILSFVVAIGIGVFCYYLFYRYKQIKKQK